MGQIPGRRAPGPTSMAARLQVRQLHYYVGGNSKVYGAALFRLRERDFRRDHPCRRPLPGLAAQIRRLRALLRPMQKRLFHVHGTRGEDPTRTAESSAPYPFTRRSKHEPKPLPKLSDEADRDRPETVSPAARHQARPEARRQGDADQHLYQVQLFRWLPVPAQRQGRRAGDLYRPDAGGARQRHAADRRLCVAARNRRRRTYDRARQRHARRAGRGLFGRYRGGGVRGIVIGAAVAAIGERYASRWPGQQVGAARSQLHAP